MPLQFDDIFDFFPFIYFLRLSCLFSRQIVRATKFIKEVVKHMVLH